MENLKSIIKSFPETKDLDLKDNELIIAYQYIKEKKAFKPNDKNHKYEPILKFDPIRVEYQYSKAYKEALELLEKAKKVDAKYYGDYILKASFKEFEILNSDRERALLKAQAFVDNFEKGKYIKGLYFYGKNRTGKTYLLSAIANELAKKDIETVFTYIPDLIRAIHGGINDNTVEARVKHLKYADLVVFDDIGSAFMSLWFRDQVFGPIIEHRLSSGLPVLFSSNLNLKTLGTHFIDEKTDTDKYNAVRLLTRITELAEEVKFSEEQYKNIDR